MKALSHITIEQCPIGTLIYSASGLAYGVLIDKFICEERGYRDSVYEYWAIVVLTTEGKYHEHDVDDWSLFFNPSTLPP